MSAQIAIENVEIPDVRRLISSSPYVSLNEDELKVLDLNLAITYRSWVGLVDGEAACAWGVIPATFLSDQAYLWLWHNDLVKAHKFIFVRSSQRVVEVILQKFPLLCGYVNSDNEDSVRWLRWLGAEFGEPIRSCMPFTIRKKQ